jgi:hypothetical protein
VEQSQGLSAWGDAEFVTQGIDTQAVLAAHQLLLVFEGIAPHQEPVRGLTAWVAGQRLLSESFCESKLPQIEVDLPQAFQRFQVEIIQMSLFYQIPIANRVVFEERTAV